MKRLAYGRLCGLLGLAIACGAEAPPEPVGSQAPTSDPAASGVRTSVGREISTQEAQALLAHATHEHGAQPDTVDLDGLLTRIASTDGVESQREILRYLTAVKQLPEAEQAAPMDKLMNLWESAE